VYRRICAVALIIFLIPATLIAHSFRLAPTQLSQIQLLNFLKNLCITGGLLFAAAWSQQEPVQKPSERRAGVLMNCRFSPVITG
jgi:putative oxidoreductase